MAAANPMSADLPRARSSGFQTCRVADFQVGSAAVRSTRLETRHTADLKVCATLNRYATSRRCSIGMKSRDGSATLVIRRGHEWRGLNPWPDARFDQVKASQTWSKLVKPR